MDIIRKEWLLMIILVLPIMYLIYLWPEMPERIPFRWDFEGNVIKTGSKYTGATICTLAPLATYIVLTLAPYIDPKKRLMYMGSKFYKLKVIISLAMTFVSGLVLYQMKNGTDSYDIRAMLIGIGLLIGLIGNYLKTIKPNYFIGIRTPWTLEDENIWKNVHVTAGRIWFIGGLGIVGSVIIMNSQMYKYILGIIITIIMLVPILHSFFLYKKKHS